MDDLEIAHVHARMPRTGHARLTQRAYTELQFALVVGLQYVDHYCSVWKLHKMVMVLRKVLVEKLMMKVL